MLLSPDHIHVGLGLWFFLFFFPFPKEPLFVHLQQSKVIYFFISQKTDKYSEGVLIYWPYSYGDPETIACLSYWVFELFKLNFFSLYVMQPLVLQLFLTYGSIYFLKYHFCAAWFRKMLEQIAKPTVLPFFFPVSLRPPDFSYILHGSVYRCPKASWPV